MLCPVLPSLGRFGLTSPDIVRFRPISVCVALPYPALPYIIDYVLENVPTGIRKRLARRYLL